MWDSSLVSNIFNIFEIYFWKKYNIIIISGCVACNYVMNFYTAKIKICFVFIDAIQAWGIRRDWYVFHWCTKNINYRQLLWNKNITPVSNFQHTQHNSTLYT